MRNREALTRYHLIDTRLRQKPRPTFRQLMDFIAKELGKPVSRRTLQTDIYELRFNQALGYNAPVIYDRRRGWYYYEDEGYSLAWAMSGVDESANFDALLEKIAEIIEGEDVEDHEILTKIKEVVSTREMKHEPQTAEQ